jgi:thiopeptide-type bacteriocin biosynthesis protein
MLTDYKRSRFSKPVNFYAGTDEWFTFNIYSGVSFLDSILTKIHDSIIEMYKENVIQSFFFVRYRDPNFHLRLRFRTIDRQNITLVVSALSDLLTPYIKENIIWKTSITGYQREVLRYGHLGIELVEDIFCQSSLITLHYLTQYEKRWHLALIYMKAVFDLLDYSLEQRAFFCKQSKEYFFKTFNFDKKTKAILKDRFTSYYSQFDQILLDQKSLPYLHYRDSLSNCFEKLNGLMHLFTGASMLTILPSILHMEFNRIFISNGKEKEAILYYLLDRYYARQLNHKND